MKSDDKVISTPSNHFLHVAGLPVSIHLAYNRNIPGVDHEIPVRDMAVFVEEWRRYLGAWALLYRRRISIIVLDVVQCLKAMIRYALNYNVLYN